MTVEITDDVVGKEVVTDGGQEMGTVAEVDDNHLYVDFTGTGDEEHEEDVDVDEIKEITDEQVVLFEPEQR